MVTSKGLFISMLLRRIILQYALAPHSKIVFCESPVVAAICSAIFRVSGLNLTEIGLLYFLSSPIPETNDKP